MHAVEGVRDAGHADQAWRDLLVRSGLAGALPGTMLTRTPHGGAVERRRVCHRPPRRPRALTGASHRLLRGTLRAG